MPGKNEDANLPLTAAEAAEYTAAYKKGSELLMKHINLHGQEPTSAPSKEAELREGLDATFLEALLPAGDGTGAGEQGGGDGAPGEAVSQQQEDVGAACDPRVGVVAVQVQQGLAFIGTQRDSTGHGLVSEVSWLVLYHSP